MSLIATRNGMPKITSKYAMSRISANIEAMAEEYGREALNVLVACMRSEDSTWADKSKAANSLLDRAYGRATDRLSIQAVIGQGSTEPTTLTTAQLIAALTPVLEHQAEPAEDVVIVDANEGHPRPGLEVEGE